MKKNIYSLLVIVSSFIALSLLNSCGNSKRLAYFNNIVKDSTAQIHVSNFETRIGKNDILQVVITTPDELTTRILNTTNNVNTGQGNGYLVDESGVIKIPLLGAVKADGLTKIKLAEAITDSLVKKGIAKSAIVNVRISNYKITVLGEVNHPGVVPVPNEHITITDAIAAAGDLTIYGRRNNILLVREQDGKRTFKRFNMNDSQVFDKDIFNLQNQDIIYVEPNNAKAAVSDRSIQLIPLAFSTISLLLVLYVRFLQ